MPHFSFTYDNVLFGWADARVSSGETELSLTISNSGGDISDAALAAIALLQNAEHSEFVWYGEPGYWHWKLDKQENNLQIKILDGWYDGSSTGKVWKILFSAETTPLKFAIQVWDSLRHLHDMMDGQDYKRFWNRPFPLDTYQRLDSLIREAKRTERAARKAHS